MLQEECTCVNVSVMDLVLQDTHEEQNHGATGMVLSVVNEWTHLSCIECCQVHIMTKSLTYSFSFRPDFRVVSVVHPKISYCCLVKSFTRVHILLKIGKTILCEENNTSIVCYLNIGERSAHALCCK